MHQTSVAEREVNQSGQVAVLQTGGGAAAARVAIPVAQVHPTEPGEAAPKEGTERNGTAVEAVRPPSDVAGAA